MNHRLEKLTTLFDAADTQLNMSNMSDIPIERENATNLESDRSRSSSINFKQISMPKSKIDSSFNEHTGEKSDTKFATSTQLNIHNRQHSKQKHFACNQCPMAFFKKWNLSSHTRTHTGERPYACDLCSMKFLQSHHLTRHRMLHTGERPYSCDLCPRKFTQSYDLTRHKRIHSGEKPYACDLCPMKFARSHHLTDHIQTHSG